MKPTDPMNPKQFATLLETGEAPAAAPSKPDGRIYEREDWTIDKGENGLYEASYQGQPFGTLTRKEDGYDGTEAAGAPMAEKYVSHLGKIIDREDPRA